MFLLRAPALVVTIMSKFLNNPSNSGSISRRRFVGFLRWSIYTAIMLLIFVLMQTPGFFAINGIKPLLLIPLVVCISIFEKELAGGIFAILTGLVWATSSTFIFGIHSIILFICCVFCGVMTTYYLQTTLLTSLVLCSASNIFYFLVEFYFRYYIWNPTGLLKLVTSVFIPTFIYTIVTTPLFYYLIKFLHKKINIELIPSVPIEEREE